MKKKAILVIGLFVALVFLISGCGGSGGTDVANDSVTEPLQLESRSYKATASAGDFIQIDLDPAHLSYEYQNISTGLLETGTFQYGEKGDLRFVMDDGSASTLLSGFEAPDIGLVLIASDTGINADKTSLVFGLPIAQISVSEMNTLMSSKSYNLLNYRASSGGFNFGGAIVADQSATITSSDYEPHMNNVYGPDVMNFLTNTVASEDGSHLIFTTFEDVGGGLEPFENYIFKTGTDEIIAVDNTFGSMLLIENTPTKDFQPEYAGLYNVVIYSASDSRTTGRGPATATRGAIAISDDGNFSVFEYDENGLGSAIVDNQPLTPVSDKNGIFLRLAPDNLYPGQNNGAFHWQDPDSEMELFVIFSDNNIFFGGTEVLIEDATFTENGLPTVMDYRYLYGIGIRPNMMSLELSEITQIDNITVKNVSAEGYYYIEDPLEFTFETTPGNDLPEGYLWDFGDGTTVYTPFTTTNLSNSARHAYTARGAYTVTAQLRHANGFLGPKVTLKNSAGEVTSLVVGGETPPRMVRFIVDDPDDGDTVLSEGDTFTILFDKPTNQAGPLSGYEFPFVVTVPSYDPPDSLGFNIPLTSYDSLCSDCRGEWTADDRYTITASVVNASDQEKIEIGSTKICTVADSDLKAAAGSAGANECITLSGDFGNGLPPGDIPFLSEFAIDFTPRSFDYSADAHLEEPVVFTVEPPTNVTSPVIGYLWIILDTSTNTYITTQFITTPELLYAFSSPGNYLVGVKAATQWNYSDLVFATVNIGSLQPPKIIDFKAANQGTVDYYERGDILQVEFDEQTDMAGFAANSFLNKAEVDNLFVFSQSIGVNYYGLWTNAQTFKITIIQEAVYPPAIGSAVIYPRTSAIGYAALPRLKVTSEATTLMGQW